MSQLVQRAEIFLWKPDPTTAFGGSPEIASQAAGQALTLIVDLDKLLPAVKTATHTATLAGAPDGKFSQLFGLQSHGLKEEKR